VLSKIGRPEQLRVSYEAGPCGYVMYRFLERLKIHCDVVAPSLIPRKPGDRVKTDRRDARKLAVMLRSGLLTPTWVPDPEHVRAPDGINPWTTPYLQWLARLQFDHTAQQVVLEEYRQDIEESKRRVARFESEIEACVTTGDHAAVVAALQAMRGVKLVTAASIVAEVGDIRRFRTPRQLMAYAGMVPSEHSSGSRTRRGAMTKSGNAHLRRVVIESGWHYRHKPVVSDALRSGSGRRRRRHVRSHGRRSSDCTSDTIASSSGGSSHRRRWSQSGVNCWDSSGRSRWLPVLPCNVRRQRKHVTQLLGTTTQEDTIITRDASYRSADDLDHGKENSRLNYALAVRRTRALSANLSRAILRDANLRDANLGGADLRGADLRSVQVSKAKLAYVNLAGAIYAPASEAPEPYIAGIRGLSSVRVPSGEEVGLVQLRKLLQDACLRDLERAATYSIQRSVTIDRFSSSFWSFAWIQSVLRFVAFHLTTAYGLHPARALVMIVLLGAVLTPIYMQAMFHPTATSGVVQVFPKDRLDGTAGNSPDEKERKPTVVQPKDKLDALQSAAYFSLISAVNIGFEQFTPGDWIRRLIPLR
jgi:transposase